MTECNNGCSLTCYFLGNILLHLTFATPFSVLGMEMRFSKNRSSSSLLLLAGKWRLKPYVEFRYHSETITTVYFMLVLVLVSWWKPGLTGSWEMGLMIIDRPETWAKNENFSERGWVKKEKNSYTCNYTIALVGW